MLRYPVLSFFILQIKFGMVAFTNLGVLQLQTPWEILSDLVCKGNTTRSRDSRPPHYQQSESMDYRFEIRKKGWMVFLMFNCFSVCG